MSKIFVKMTSVGNSYTDVTQHLVMSGSKVYEVEKTKIIAKGLENKVITEVSEKEAKSILAEQEKETTATQTAVVTPNGGTKEKSLDEMSWDELKAAATAKGIPFKHNASKADLKTLLTGGTLENPKETRKAELSPLDEASLKALLTEKAIEFKDDDAKDMLVELILEKEYPEASDK